MPDVGEQNSVAKHSVAYEQMAAKFPLIDDLCGGTTAMREAGERWLPKMDKEQDGAYNHRLNRSILYEAFSDTLDRLAGKPFSRDVTAQGELPKQFDGFLDNVDKTGTSITQFARDAFTSACKYGVVHALVDFSRVPKGATKADVQRIGARPAWVLVEAPSLIGWKTETGPDGVPELTQIRIKECRVESDGEFADKEVEYIRVITKTEWQLWKKVEQTQEGARKIQWVLDSEGQHTFGAVPLFSLYFNRTNFMVGEPPLEALAWLNIAHWQSDSDQRNLLSVARCGILFAKGFSEDEIEKGIVIGPNHVVSTESTEAELKFVEHTGKAIGSGREEIQDIERRMEILGLKPLIERTSSSTAFGRAADENSNDTTIQTWIRAEEAWLLLLLEAAAKWMGVTLPADTNVDIFNEFGIRSGDSSTLMVLLTACLQGKISHKTFLREWKRRAVLSDSVDPDKEIDDIAEELPDVPPIEDDEPDDEPDPDDDDVE